MNILTISIITKPAVTNCKILMSCCVFLTLVFAQLSSAQTSAPQPNQQVALVTGSTSGLGRELAMRLSDMGMFVIVHGRNRERGLEVIAEIESNSGNGASLYIADFASLDQIRNLGETILADFGRLDILVNNAGIGSSPNERLLSDDGHELRFQVNYLSHFLLSDMLRPLLLEAAPSRIVNIASIAQQEIDFDDVMIASNFSGGRAYAQSKLAQVLFTIDLAERLEGTDIIVNALHPATYMDTNMVRSAGARPRATVDEGADAVMLLITDDIGSGGYFNGKRSARANSQAYSEEARSKLWQLSEALVVPR